MCVRRDVGNVQPRPGRAGPHLSILAACTNCVDRAVPANDDPAPLAVEDRILSMAGTAGGDHVLFDDVTRLDYAITWVGLVAGLVAVGAVGGLDRRLGRVRRWPA